MASEATSSSSSPSPSPSPPPSPSLPSSSPSPAMGAPSTAMLSVLSAIFQDLHASTPISPSSNSANVAAAADLQSVALSKDPLTGEALLKRLEQIVRAARSASKDQTSGSAKLSPLKSLSLTVASLSNYLDFGLSATQLKEVASTLADGAATWLKELLKLRKHSSAAFTKNEEEARVLAVRAAMLKAYPDLLSEGFLAIKQTPVIYTSLPSLFNQQVLTKLGLGANTVRHVLPTDLEAAIEKDRAEGRLPLLIAGVLCPERTDDVASLRQTAKKHRVWLHIEGDDVGLLIAGITFRAIFSSDSFSLATGKTLGLAFKSATVFFRESISPALYDTSAALLYSIVVWAGLLFLGTDTLTKSVSKAAELSKDLATRLSVAQGISVKHPGVSLSTLFRYAPRIVDDDADFQDSSFLNNLNKQLLLDLHDSAAALGLDVHSVNGSNYLRFQPLSLPNLPEVNKQSIGNFVGNLKKLTELINQTVKSRPAFRGAVEKIEGLNNVKVVNFVGLGAVRYTPRYLQGPSLAPEVSAQIDEVNRNLAEKLTQQDPLFSQGVTVEGEVCVCLGVETSTISTDAPTLYAQKISDIINNSETDRKIVENIGEIVKKSIEETEAQLRRESEDAYYQQSLIGRMPVVGSVWNWYWETPEPETSGRSFELASKSIRATELRRSTNATGTLSPSGSVISLPSSSSSSSLVHSASSPSFVTTATTPLTPPVESPKEEATSVTDASAITETPQTANTAEAVSTTSSATTETKTE